MKNFSVICMCSALLSLIVAIGADMMGWATVTFAIGSLAGCITLASCVCFFYATVNLNGSSTSADNFMQPDELDKCVGTYISPDMQMKICVTMEEDDVLHAQATGYSLVPLLPLDKNVFNYSVAGITMEFRPDNNKFALIQNGGYFPFIKEA
jgi:hypothetical protein